MDQGVTEVLSSNIPINETKTYVRATNEHPAVPDDAEIFDGLNSYMSHMQVKLKYHIRDSCETKLFRRC